MRIAHFIQRYPPAIGGSEAYFARLSRYLVQQGDAVTVFTTNGYDLDAFWSERGRLLKPGQVMEDGVAVRRYPLRRWNGQRYALKALSYLPNRRLQCLTVSCNPVAPGMWSDAARTSAFDIVHAGALPYAFPILCGLRLARRLGVPFVLTPFLHIGDPANPRDPTRRGYLAPAMQYLIHAADCLFVQTALEREALLDIGVPSGKLALLGMGVDAAECTGGRREATRQAWNIGQDEIVVGHLANQSAEKGTVDLVEASKQLWQQDVRFRLVLAGPEMPNFTAYWRRQPRALAVTRLGVLSEPAKRDFFAAIDLFCLPSRSDSFGLVFLEAWANGVPSVAYRAGGVPGVIRHDQDGLLVPCGDIEALAAALKSLMSDRERGRRFGQTGWARVQTEFQWPPRLAAVRTHYARLKNKK